MFKQTNVTSPSFKKLLEPFCCNFLDILDIMQCMIVKDTDRMYGDCCRQSKNEDVSTVLIVIWKRQILWNH